MNETNDASAMFAPIWRRKWVILAVAILVALGTFLYYKHQRPHYGASTQVYLGAGAEEQIPLSGTGAKKSSAPEGKAQAVLINSPIIKQAVRAQLRKQRKSKAVKAALKGKVKAKAAEKSQFITITAEARSAKGASLLADATAQAYTHRQNSKYKRAVESAISLARRQRRRIEASAELQSTEQVAAAKKAAKTNSSGTGTAPVTRARGTSTSIALQIAQLSSKINQLESNLGVVSVRQVSPARPQKLSASPKKNAVFGFVIGLLLASFVAYVLARLDNRLRTIGEIEAAFGAQILTALASVRRPVVLNGGEPRPSRLLLDAVQRLSTALSLARVAGPEAPRSPRTILFLSAQSGDGKSTLVADLALVQRDAGASVAIVEADLRRPTLARLLGAGAQHGLADVLAGTVAVSGAMQAVGGRPQAAPAPVGPGVPAVATIEQAGGSVSLLLGGVANNPSVLLSGPAMGETLQAIAAEHDYVLIDAPPPLEVSDAVPLLGLVDAIVIVARAGQTRAVAAERLCQLLARTPSAPVLGVVANGVAQKDIERYGFSTYADRGWRSRIFRR
jgi:Mrp family chromosome partitioning ATPase/capsular polysaccharide biosynthesis protein